MHPGGVHCIAEMFSDNFFRCYLSQRIGLRGPARQFLSRSPYCTFFVGPVLSTCRTHPANPATPRCHGGKKAVRARLFRCVSELELAVTSTHLSLPNGHALCARSSNHGTINSQTANLLSISPEDTSVNRPDGAGNLVVREGVEALNCITM